MTLFFSASFSASYLFYRDILLCICSRCNRNIHTPQTSAFSCCNISRFLLCMHVFFVFHDSAAWCNWRFYVPLNTKDSFYCNNHCLQLLLPKSLQMRFCAFLTQWSMYYNLSGHYLHKSGQWNNSLRQSRADFFEVSGFSAENSWLTSQKNLNPLSLFQGIDWIIVK